MKTHENRALFSRALLKATTCLFLTAGIGISAAYAAPRENTQATSIVQQSSTVNGKITDANGEPIIGASVVIKGTTNGTITDFDGNFMLEVPAKATLVVSYVGYKTLEVPVNGKKTLNINLKEDTEMLDEVVVVGYGTQKKATLTGSVSQVGGEELKKVAATNLTNTLAGKTAGVIANTRSGEPGEDNADILIRGKGTLGSTSPLIVVDGIADRSFSRLNPEDIESISVLKDASAAIYGARAANGVILVTTKRGTEGKVKINYSGNVSFSQPTRIPEMLDSYQYATYVNEYDAGHGEAATYSAEALGMIQSGEDQIRYPNTDWWSEVAKDWATKTQHSLAISGGNDKISFYTSAQYMYQDAIYKKGVQDYNQYQFTTNLDAKITKAIKFSMDILGRQEVRNRGVYSTEDLFGYFLTTNPMAAPYYPNGLLRVGYDGVTNNAAVKVTDIPGTNKTTYSTLNLKPRLRVDLDVITKGLYVEGYAALDFHFNDGKQINNPYDVYQYDAATDSYINRRDATGSISVNQWFNKDKTITLNARLGYSHDFKGGHHVDAFIAYEQSKYDYTGISAYRTNYLSTTIPEIFAGSDVAKDKDNSGSSNVTARQNYFGRINYAYKDKYLAEFTMRYDGSMNFASNKRWGTFPGLSVGWRMSEEDFIKNNFSFINDLKLRASWGKLGNDRVDAFQYISTYNMQNGAILGEIPNINKGFVPGRVGNPDITWEKVDSKNIAVDGNFWNALLAFTVEYFYQNRTDILTPKQASIPYYTGLTLPDQNIGEVSNQGVELMLSHKNRINDINYFVSGNFTFTKNKIKFFDEAANTPEWQRRTGHSIDSWLMYKTDGIYQSWDEINSTPHMANAQPGDIKYLDIDDNGVINDNDRIRSKYGNVPQIVYGLNMGIEWKGLEFSMLWTGQARAEQMIVPYSYNLDKEFYNNRWISAEETPNSKYPRAFDKDDYENTRWSDFWLYDASFIRLKNVELAYTFPKSFVEKLKIQNLRLVLTGTNLLTFDKVKVQDPESDATSTGQKYPQARTYTFGVNVSF